MATPAEEAVLAEKNEAFTKGIEAQSKGRFATAILELNRALQMDPRDPLVREALAKTYDAMGRFEDARLEYREALRRRPGMSSSIWYDARNLARYGELCEKANDPREALKAYQAAVSEGVFNDSEVSIAARGKDLASLRAAAEGLAGIRAKSHGDDAAAEAFLRRATISDPLNGAVSYHLGDALRRLGRFREADAEMAKAEISPNVDRTLVKDQRGRLRARFN